MNDCPHTLIYREILRIARADPVLRTWVKTWVTWEGKPVDRMDLAVNLCPWLSLMPVEGADTFYGPSGFRGPLGVQIGLAVQGTDLPDLMNKYHSIRQAFYPADDAARVAIRSALVAAGALTGEPVFMQAAFGQQPPGASGVISAAQGQMFLELRVINP